MKRHRKLVALLVALTFLFSIVAPVMAATPSEAEKAADKLNVLGIIEGYPDGSFGLDRNITRAEFAKIAVVAAGLKDAAEQLVNFPSQFSDVKVGEWYTGWINMAASQGFVKGDPAGTFRPNDNITY
ncbi:MAG TPA: S-layer homology domain-containing protein, partial [Clostridia bacterium]|nr:S-layer homology domain-containing protein [Clostridia bacterium]